MKRKTAGISLRFEFLSVKGLSKSDLADLNRLLPQVSRTPHTITRKELRNALTHGFVFVARDATNARRRIIGMATLAPVYTVRRKRGDVHDVVVDEAYRGRGIGTKLLTILIAHAKKIGIARLDLTSGPSRRKANRLYQNLGFTLHRTNCYRLELKQNLNKKSIHK